MIDIKMLQEMIISSSVVVVKFDGIKECSVTTKIYNPIVDVIDGTVIISNHADDTDENEIQFDLNNFEFNEYNSDRNKLVFNSELNFANSLSIQRIDEE